MCNTPTENIKMELGNILYNINKAKEFEDDSKNKEDNRKLSEIDTQVLLVEPVLKFAGYELEKPFIIKRASRNNTIVQFDIEVYDEKGDLKIGIEVKSLSSSEFNIQQINDSIKKIGIIEEKLFYKKNGKFIKTKKNKWTNTRTPS